MKNMGATIDAKHFIKGEWVTSNFHAFFEIRDAASMLR